MGTKTATRRKRREAEQPIWDITEIAAYLGIHHQTLRRWVRLGTAVGRVIRQIDTGRWYAYPSELDAVMKR